MGRLTLNILLSFAQFEREILQERIKDKFAASRQRGMWMGGHPPLGYDIQNRALIVNEQEVKQIQFIFQRYAECGSITQVIQDLKEKRIHNKTWTTDAGKLRQGKPFNKTSLNRILKNRVYIGEAVHRDRSFPGQHKAIIDLALWDRVQQNIANNNRPNSSVPRGQTPFPLRGLVRCKHCGTSMTPTHTKKNGQVQYRYYSCSGMRKGSSADCPIPNIPAGDLERMVLEHVKKLITSPEIVAETISQVKEADPDFSEAEIIELLKSLTPVWDELFPLEQNRLLKLLIERIDMTENGADLILRVDGINMMMHELSEAEEVV